MTLNEELRKSLAGRYIAIDGMDGVGKGTQLQYLADYLVNKLKLDVLRIREPGSTLVGEQLRNLLLHLQYDKPLAPQAQALLFMAARSQMAFELIAPARQRGQFILADRCVASTWAYQGKLLDYVEREALQSAYRLAMPFVLRPDMIIILDAPAETCRARLAARGTAGKESDQIRATTKDYFEARSADYFVETRAAYSHFVDFNPRARLINAEGTAEAIFAVVLETIRQFFQPRGSL